jgi:hypothetical protein
VKVAVENASGIALRSKLPICPAVPLESGSSEYSFTSCSKVALPSESFLWASSARFFASFLLRTTVFGAFSAPL